MRIIDLTTLAALATLGYTFKLNPKGQAISYDLHRRAPPQGRLQRRDDNTLELTTPYTSGLYYINITLGTPGQSLAVQIDTGSSDFWVPDSNGGCPSGCLLGGFDPSQSSSYQVTQPGAFNITYGDLTSSTGDFGTDVLQMAGFTLDNITVGIATKVTSTVSIEGIIGLGFDDNEANVQRGSGQINPTVLDGLVSAGKIGAHVYSLYLNDIASPGSLLFGGIDTAKYSGDLTILDLQTDANNLVSAYMVALTGVAFSNGAGASSSTGFGDPIPALLDSGTTNTILPDDVALNIYEGLGLPYIPGLGAFAPCDLGASGYSLNFTFGGENGVTIGVPISGPSEGIPAIDGVQMCQFLLAPTSSAADGQNTVILGDSFLRGAYLVFDLDDQVVGMAPAILNVTTENIVAVGGTNAQPATSGLPQTMVAIANILPSAATIASQASVIVTAKPSNLGVRPSLVTTGITIASATFSGLSSGTAKPSHNAASAAINPLEWTSLMVSGVTMVLMVMGGGLLAVL